MKNFKLLAIPFLVIIASCSPKNEKDIKLTNPENGEKTNVKITTDKDGKQAYSIQSENGEVIITGGKGSLPKSFPEFITLYPGANDLSSIDTKNEKNANLNNAMANFTTNDDAAKVASFYKAKLAPFGYIEKGNFNYGNMVMTSLVNEKTEQALQITASKGENETVTTVQLIFAKLDKK